MSYKLVYGPMGGGVIRRKEGGGWTGSILSLLLHNLQLVTTNRIYRGVNLMSGPTPPSI